MSGHDRYRRVPLRLNERRLGHLAAAFAFVVRGFFPFCFKRLEPRATTLLAVALRIAGVRPRGAAAGRAP